MVDIQIISEGDNAMFFHAKFQKKLWHDSEIVLARCFNFDINIDTGTIIATFVYTDKQALLDFIRVSFKNFWESYDEQPRKEAFLAQVDAIYAGIDASVLAEIKSKLPYADKLYKHQLEGLRFSYFNRAIFLAFGMRLGKTIISASLSRLFNIKRTLVICPAVAKMGWFRDLTGFWGFNELYWTVLDAAKSKTFVALQERFVVVNYDSLSKFMPHILSSEIGHIIIDESHRIKSTSATRTKNVMKIVETFPNAKITMLSGTPIPNRFNDLFSYFKITGHHLGQSYKKFCDEFTITSAGRGGDKVTGAKNIAELKMKMQNFMIVRTMEECLDMPEDVVSRYTFQMDDYRPEYDKIIKEMTEAKELAALNGHIHSLNRLTCKSKLPGIIEALEDIIEETGKVVVFGTYKEPLQQLQDHFKERCVKVVGGVSSYQRDQYKQQFHADPNLQVFLANYEAGGEALDLSVSNDIFIINFPLTTRELNQALFRCKHPEKKNKHLRVHFTFCENSIDEHIYDNIIIDKQIDINMLLHDGKDVMHRENVTEKLIKSILGKNDVNFIHGHKKADAGAAEKLLDASTNDTVGLRRGDQLLHEAETEGGGNTSREMGVQIGKWSDTMAPLQSELGSEINKVGLRISPEWDSKKNHTDFQITKTARSQPKYYLLDHCSADEMLISNEAQLEEYLGQSFDIIFSHVDVNQVIMTGRYKQMLSKSTFNDKYTPNPKFNLPVMQQIDLTPIDMPYTPQQALSDMNNASGVSPEFFNIDDAPPTFL